MKSNNHLISPSILSADFGRIYEVVEMINSSEADWFHIDVMDGMFVPNISFGFPVMEAVKRKATKPMDVHLMIEKPERYIERFRDAGAHVITVHYEACNHLHRVIQQIKETGALAGVAINPHTPVTHLVDILEDRRSHPGHVRQSGFWRSEIYLPGHPKGDSFETITDGKESFALYRGGWRHRSTKCRACAPGRSKCSCSRQCSSFRIRIRSA